MKHTCECLINSGWWVFECFQVLEIFNIKTVQSFHGLLNKWQSCIQVLLDTGHFSLNPNLNFTTDICLDFSLVILSFDFDLFSSDNFSLFIG